MPAPSSVADQRKLIIPGVDHLITHCRIIGDNFNFYSGGGQVVFHKLGNLDVIARIGGDHGNADPLPRKEGGGLFRLVGVLDTVFIVVDASGRGIPGAAGGAHPTEHLIHHRLTVERLIKPFAHCQLEKFGMLFKVDQQLIAHVVRLFDHSNRRIGGVTFKKIGRQPGDIDFPIFKGQQLIAHRHKLNPVGGGFTGTEAVKGGELIAPGRSIVGGKAVRAAAR